MDLERKEINDQPAESSENEVQTSQGVSLQYSGPIPPPSILEGYERLLPGAADRILSMAEKEQQHRHQLEKDESVDNRLTVKRGAIFAFIITLSVVACGTYVIAIGKSGAGIAVILGALASLVSAFITGRTPKKSKISKKINRQAEEIAEESSSEKNSQS